MLVSRERRESLREEECFKPKLENCNCNYCMFISTSLMRTVCGSEFQTAGAEHRKARFANVVVVKGWYSAIVVDRRLRPCSRSWIRSRRYDGIEVLRTLEVRLSQRPTTPGFARGRWSRFWKYTGCGKKYPRKDFWQYFPDDWKILNKILHAYCMFIST